MTDEAVTVEQVQEEEHAHPPYWIIFVILVVLTVIEVAFADLDWRLIAVGTMVAVAIAKIYYIAQYFMHLKFDSKILTLIAAVPLVFGSVMAIALLMDFL